MVHEILNIADTPTVIDQDSGFSTGEVNYYSRPCMSTLLCDITYDRWKTSLRVSFADKELPEDQIKTQFEETCQWLKGNTEKWKHLT